MKLLSFLVFSIIILSCQADKKEDLSNKSKIQILLNNQQYDDALTLTHQELENSEKDDELMFFLVSSLSGKAGIDVANIFPIFKMAIMEKRKEAMVIESSFIEKRSIQEIIEDRYSEEDEESLLTKDFLISYIHLFSDMSNTLTIISMLPHLDDQQYNFAKEAISILKDHKFSGIYEDYAFQFLAVITGTLSVKIIKKYLTIKNTDILQYLCDFDFNQLRGDLEDLSFYLHTFNENRRYFKSEIKSLLKLDNSLKEFLHSSQSINDLYVNGFQDAKDSICRL